MPVPRLLCLLPLLLLLAGCPLQEMVKKEQGEEAAPERDMNQVLDEARASYQAKEWKTAERDYRLVVEKDPSSFEAWFRLGNIYSRSERPELAIRAYQEALIRNPEDVRAWHNLSVVHLRRAINTLEQMEMHADPDHPMTRKDRELLEGLRRLVGAP